MTRRTGVTWLLVACCALGGVVAFDAGCKTNNISASGEDVTQVIGPNGGGVHFDDLSVSVSIPAGALAQNTEVRLHAVSSGYPPLPSGTPNGTLVYALEPFGTTTALAFQVRINGSGAIDRADPVTNWASLPTDNANGQAMAQSSAFGYFALTSGSGTKTGGDDGGTSFAEGGPPGGGNTGDGTVVASNLASVSTQSGFACDDAFAYYESTYQDPLNGTVNRLMAAPLSGGGAPVQVAQAQGFMGLAVSNGAVYWVEGSPGGMSYALKSASAPGFSPQTVTTWSGGGGGGYSNTLSANGNNLWFLEAQTLHRYDTKANMLDSMTYGQTKQAPMAATFAGTSTGVMYFGGTTNYTLYTATPGSAPVTSGASIPSTAQIVAFAADGTNALFVASGSGTSFLYSLDSTSSSATPKQLASLSAAGGGGGANGFVATGGYIFTTLGPSGSATEPITRYSVADGSSSVVGHYLSQGQTGKPIVVTASSVYVLENNPSGGGQIEKWARP